MRPPHPNPGSAGPKGFQRSVAESKFRGGSVVSVASGISKSQCGLPPGPPRAARDERIVTAMQVDQEAPGSDHNPPGRKLQGALRPPALPPPLRRRPWRRTLRPSAASQSEGGASVILSASRSRAGKRPATRGKCSPREGRRGGRRAGLAPARAPGPRLALPLAAARDAPPRVRGRPPTTEPRPVFNPAPATLRRPRNICAP